MNINDPIGDMITRIRNAHLRGKDTVDSPSSNLILEVFQLLIMKMVNLKSKSI